MSDILVIGGCNLDIKAKALEENQLGTSNPGVISTSPGGVARNIAHNLARLGMRVALISATGNDHKGDEVLAATAKAGVNISQVSRKAPATGTYLAVLHPGGELVTAMSDMRAIDLITPEVIRMQSSAINAAAAVVVDCNLPLLTLEAVAGLARHKLFVEPVSVTKSKKLLHVLKAGPVFLASPNLDQLESLTGSHDITIGCQELHARGVQNIIVHAGKAGAFVSEGAGITHVPPQQAAEIVDVTGAGDAAIAGLIFGLSQGDSLVAAAKRGQQIAGLVIASSRSTLE